MSLVPRRPKTFKAYAVWFVGLLLVAAVLLQLWYALHILWWKWLPVNNTAFMSANLAVLQAKDPKAVIKHTWVNYDKISNHQPAVPELICKCKSTL